MNLLLKNIPFYKKELAGLSLYLSSSGIVECYYVLTETKSGNTIIQKKIKTQSLEVLSTEIDLSIPISLTIDGKGILHKAISTQNWTNAQIIQSIIPTGNESDFYLQITNEIVSISRKETIDNLLSPIATLGFNIISIQIGFYSTLIFSDIIDTPNITLPHYNLTKKDGNWNFEKANNEEKTINILDTSIEIEYLEPYCSAFNLILIDNSSGIQHETVTTNKENWSWGKLLNFSIYGALSVFFFALLINFILFTSLHQKNAELQSKLEQTAGKMSEISLLKQQTDAKENFLKESGWMESSLVSFYADRIAKSVPKEVELIELAIYPLDYKKLKETKKNSFQINKIEIKGTTSHSIYLNGWISSLKKNMWINDIEVNYYKFQNEKQKGEFSIFIKI